MCRVKSFIVFVISCVFFLTIFSGCAGTTSDVSTSTNSAPRGPLVTYHPQIPSGIHTMEEARNDLKGVLENIKENENLCADFGSSYLSRNDLTDLVGSEEGRQQIMEGLHSREKETISIHMSTPPDLMFNWLKSIAVLEDRLEVSSRLFILYSDLPCLQIEFDSWGRVYLGDDGEVVLYLPSLEDAKRVANDLIFIQQQFKTCSFQEKADQFESLAKKFREQSAKPVVSEEQRKYIVQANLLTKQKDYRLAIEFFHKALAVDQVAYPDAYFNLAMLYAQTGYYRSAIDQMKKYLSLVPDAKDARSARDKIYEWELQMKK